MLRFLGKTQGIHILLSEYRIESHVDKDGNDGGSDGVDSCSHQVNLKGQFRSRLS